MKKLISAVMATVCAMSVTASATVLEFQMNSTTLNIQNNDGITSKTLDVAPFTVNDRTVVPVRVISESFGADVKYNEADETVTITKGDKVIILTIGKDFANVNGLDIQLDVTAFTENGRTMVPVRFVSEQLGYQVEYEEIFENVLITDEPAAMMVSGIPVSQSTYKMLYDEFTNSDYSQDKAENVKMVESIITEIYSLSNGATLSEESKTTFKDTIDYEGYLQVATTLKTTYTQLMKKNLIAGEFYRSLSASDLIKSSDEDIKEQYNNNYVTAKHILIPTMDMETGMEFDEKEKTAAKNLAYDIYNKVQKGQDFDELMKAYSKDTGLEHYPDGYTFTRDEMVPEFEKASFDLDTGKVSSPIESMYGYHIIKKEPLAPITEELKATIEMERASSMLDLLVQSKISETEIIKNEEVINSIIGE
ncbi:MAG: stalk domain-containing protein [Eubacteriales bacterium]|nr:stalk domain-containing protein [Eubacteriales bacterium]